jgi:hypothetical protein
VNCEIVGVGSGKGVAGAAWGVAPGWGGGESCLVVGAGWSAGAGAAAGVGEAAVVVSDMVVLGKNSELQSDKMR